MKITNKNGGSPVVEPVIWLLRDGYVEHEGRRYHFWYEYDGRDGDVHCEFNDDEPDGDFDYGSLEAECQVLCDLARRVPDIAVTEEQVGAYLEQYGCDGDYVVVCKGYDGDWDNYTELTPEDIAEGDPYFNDYEDYRLWLKGDLI